MKFNIRQLLYFTTLIASHLFLRSWWTSTGIPIRAGLIPLTLAAAVALYFAWTRRSVLATGLAGGATALLSASSIAAEVMLDSKATDFLRTAVDDAQFHTDPTRNVIAVAVITVVCLLGGALLAFVLRRFRSRLARWQSDSSEIDHRTANTAVRVLRSPWIQASGAGLFILGLCLLASSRARVTEWTTSRIRAGMHRQQVESILGHPNPLPDLRSKGEAFWDGHTHLGRRYVCAHVVYDADGEVDQVETDGFWRARPWSFW
jgi:hypothetical protein